MSEWIDFAVYAAFTSAVWGWLPAGISRSTIPMIADRNPEWLAGHPDLQRLAQGGWFTRLCLLWGVLSLFLLLAFQAGAWPQALAFPPATPKWDALRTLHAALSIIGFIMLAGCAGIFLRWLHLNVPLAARRQATLERRSIHAYVPPAFQYAISGVVVLHLGLWVVAGVTGRYATPAFWGLLVFQFAIAAMFLSFALFAVRRRPGQMDRIFGPGYRRTEVRVAFAAQLLPLMNGLTRLYEQVAGTPVDHVDRVLHLALVLAVLGVAILVGSWSRQTGRSSKASWMPPAKSAGALFVAFMALAALPA